MPKKCSVGFMQNVKCIWDIYKQLLQSVKSNTLFEHNHLIEDQEKHFLKYANRSSVTTSAVPRKAIWDICKMSSTTPNVFGMHTEYNCKILNPSNTITLYQVQDQVQCQEMHLQKYANSSSVTSGAVPRNAFICKLPSATVPLQM